jgi:hypothetical protein
MLNMSVSPEGMIDWIYADELKPAGFGRCSSGDKPTNPAGLRKSRLKRA